MISIFTIMNNPHSCWSSISCNRININTDIFIEVPPFSHDGASVLACAYQLKVRSKNSKNFEYWLCRWLWVKFIMFLLNSPRWRAFPNARLKYQFYLMIILLFSLTTSFCLFLVRYKHASGDARYLGKYS